LLEGVREDETLQAPSQLSIEADEIRSRIYDKLASGLRSVVAGKVPEQDAREILNEAIYEIFNTYANYKERYSLRDFARVVTRNKVSAYFRQRGRHVNMEDSALEKLISEKDPEPPLGHDDLPERSTSLEDLLGLIRVDDEQISEKEFLVFVLKAANCCIEKKLSEDKLAAMVGLKRTTFRDLYQKARDKIYQQWQETREERRAKGEEQNRIGPAGRPGAKGEERRS
jgi:RNA polymerase sigma factor (sigma-70 family)